MNIEKSSPNNIADQKTDLVRPGKERNLIQESIDGLNQWIVEARCGGEEINRVSFGNIEVSIQAGSKFACNPKSDSADKYTEVELGFPSEQPPGYIMEYAYDPDHPTETVYLNVPIELVARWASETGGLKALPMPEEQKKYEQGI